MESHFRNPAADALTVTNVSLFQHGDSREDSISCLLILEPRKPSLKRGRVMNFEHRRQVRLALPKGVRKWRMPLLSHNSRRNTYRFSSRKISSRDARQKLKTGLLSSTADRGLAGGLALEAYRWLEIRFF